MYKSIYIILKILLYSITKYIKINYFVKRKIPNRQKADAPIRLQHIGIASRKSSSKFESIFGGK